MDPDDLFRLRCFRISWQADDLARRTEPLAGEPSHEEKLEAVLSHLKTLTLRCISSLSAIGFTLPWKQCKVSRPHCKRQLPVAQLFQTQQSDCPRFVRICPRLSALLDWIWICPRQKDVRRAASLA